MDQSGILMSLTRQGIGHNCSALKDKPDWVDIKALAEKQGLSAIVLDGIQRLPLENRPSKDILLNWIGTVIQGFENRYKCYERALSDLAKFYNENGINMMVLKGYGLSMNYPIPNHRPCGDIDIWNYGLQKKADSLVVKQFGIRVDNSEPHHSCFDWKGFLVENHYDFLIVPASKTNSEIEPLLKELAKVKGECLSVCGQDIYLPTPDFNALFLLRHMLMHFVAIGITIRHLLDWAFFWEKYGEQINKEWLSDLIDQFKMTEFFNVVNAICVDDLGFDSLTFPCSHCPYELKQRVLSDILNPEYDSTEVYRLKLLPRLIFKYKRWKSGSWKRRFCYKEGVLSSFLWSAWSHIMKPSTI